MGAKEKMNDKYGFSWDFSGGPVVKTLPSNGGGGKILLINAYKWDLGRQ